MDESIGKLIINIINNFKTRVKNVVNKKISGKRPSKRLRLLSLTPTNNADENKVYEAALIQALQFDDVRNIAITGAYGAGKSSVIKTFFHNNKTFKPAFISLSTFDSADKKSNEELQLIERSILQQLFYSVPQESLPLSRFKRITDPNEYSILKYVLLLSIFSFKTWFYITSDDTTFPVQIAHKTFQISMDWWYPYWNVAMLIFISTYLIIQVLKNLMKLTELKMNIHSAEITIKNSSSASILNDHLDEVLYFFNRTKTKLVVIEDLDRFKSSDIFIRLRELNSILNFNNKDRDPIRFIYAVKDDIFVNRDRTKFFDFIIPIIPIVNPTNAYDLVKQDYPNLNKLDDTILRQICLYFDDLRLLRNVFNEFQIYTEKQVDLNIDPNKLLGLIVYKNYCPDDFAKLHRNDGKIHEIFNAWKNESIVQITKQLRDELAERESKIAASAEEHEVSVKNLNLLYGAEILRRATEHHTGNVMIVKSQQKIFSANELLDGSTVAELLKASTFTVHQQNNTHHSLLKVDISEIDKSIDKFISYEERLNNIKAKHDCKTEEFAIKTASIRMQIKRANRLTLKEILRDFPALSLPETKSELLNYLLREGHIDEAYPEYVSLFFPSLITVRDKNFILSVNGRKPPQFDYALEKISEILNVYLSEKSFSISSVLNFSLADYLVSDGCRYHGHRIAFFDLIADETELSVSFIRAYVTRGASLHQFLPILAKHWPSFLNYFVEWKDDEMIRRCLKFIDSLPHQLTSQSNLQNYLSHKENPVAFLQAAFDYQEEKILNFLLVIRPTFRILDSPPNSTELLNSIAESEFYIFNQENILSLININSLAPERLTLGNSPFTAIDEAKIGYLSNQLEKNIQRAIKFLIPDDCLSEPEEIIVKLLNKPIDEESKREIIAKCTTTISNLNGIKDKTIWKDLVAGNKVEAAWKNVISYLLCEDNGPDESLANFINTKRNFVSLLEDTFTPGSDADTDGWIHAWEHLIGWNLLTDEAYEAILDRCDLEWDDISFDQISIQKVRSLIEHGCLGFSLPIVEYLRGGDLDVYQTYLRIKAQQITKSDEALFKLLRIDDLENLVTSNIDTKLKCDLLIRAGHQDIEYSELLQYESIKLFADSKMPEHLSDTLFVKFAKTQTATVLLTAQIPYMFADQIIGKTSFLTHGFEELFDNMRTKNISYSEPNVALANALSASGLCEKPDIADDIHKPLKFKLKPLRKAA